MARIAINGFGRIGRCILRAALARREAFDLVAINDIDKPSTLAYLLKYDSIHGPLEHEVRATDHSLFVDGKEIEVTALRDPSAGGESSSGTRQ